MKWHQVKVSDYAMGMLHATRHFLEESRLDDRKRLSLNEVIIHALRELSTKPYELPTGQQAADLERLAEARIGGKTLDDIAREACEANSKQEN